LKQLAIWLLGAALLVGCAQTPDLRLPPRDSLRDFALDGRFALRITQPDGRSESGSGRLSWTHENRMDRVLIATPLGAGLAEIDSAPGRATLRTSDERIYTADEPDRLLAEVTGYPLPISRLPGWLLGRPGADGTLERDAQARPLRLREDDWLIEYTYGDDNPDALPQQLRAAGKNIELRLRLETWKSLP
jgi:outer membrane lipoprotein LolB